MARFTLGLMSGTSMDGIDCALVDQSNQFVAGMTRPYSDDLSIRLKKACDAEAISICELMALNRLVGQAFAEAVLSFLQTNNLSKDDILVIGSHGQTIAHDSVASIPYTLQIGCPHTIAQMSKIPVIADFRTRDMVVGGQGAPFAPWYHEQIFKHLEQPMAVVNVGGIANISYLCSETTIGYDVGPGNALMDQWIQRHLGLAYDEGGQLAASGVLIPKLLSALLEDDYFHRPLPKSIGKEYFSLDWLCHYLTGNEAIADVQKTLLYLTAYAIQKALIQLNKPIKKLIVCGGGVHNLQLMRCLKDLLAPIPLQSSNEYSVSPDYMEAMMMAWLARQSYEHRFIDMSMITGAQTNTILGAYYPAGE